MDDTPAQSITDEMLLRRVGRQDQDSLATLYARWSGPLMGIGLRFSGSRAEVEDIIHDVFLEIWKTAGDFDPNRGTARTWIVMKMRCRMLDHVRKAQRHHALKPTASEAISPSAPAAAPDDAYEHQQLRRVMMSLPERLQSVLLMTYFEHLPAHEIAARLDVPVGTVKSRLASARRELAALLAPDYGGGGQQESAPHLQEGEG